MHEVRKSDDAFPRLLLIAGDVIKLVIVCSIIWWAPGLALLLIEKWREESER